jgi:hypothetical protein
MLHKVMRTLFEEVAVTLPQGDDRRARLLAVSRDALAEEATVRPVIAAKILGLCEKTVRAWADAGLLATTQRSPPLLLDVPSVHRVSHILRELYTCDGGRKERRGRARPAVRLDLRAGPEAYLQLVLAAEAMSLKSCARTLDSAASSARSYPYDRPADTCTKSGMESCR